MINAHFSCPLLHMVDKRQLVSDFFLFIPFVLFMINHSQLEYIANFKHEIKKENPCFNEHCEMGPGSVESVRQVLNA